MASHEGEIIIGPFGENSRAFFCIFTYDSSLAVFSQLSSLNWNLTNVTCTLSFLCRVMISLSEVTYSQDTRVAAVRDYIFLTQMYLDEKLIKEPPKGGRLSITPESMRRLGKTDQVISLLRHPPALLYVCRPESSTKHWALVISHAFSLGLVYS